MTERTFTFRLSASGVDEVVRTLRQAGDAGEQMAQKLVNASPQIGNALERARVQIDATRISLERTQAVAARGIGGPRFQQGLQQAGFQIGDFITQVQGGGNAFVAFAQQGGQLAGALAGGLAGLLVQIAAVGAQYLATRDSATSLAGAQAGLNSAIQEAAEYFETAAERAERLDRAQRRALASGIETQLATQRAAFVRATEQANALRAADRAFARPGTATSRPLEEISRNRAAEIEREAEQAARNIARLEGELQRILTVSRGTEQFGPPAPPASGARGGGRVAGGGELERVLGGLRREQEDITRQAQALAAANRTADEVYQDQIQTINDLLPRLVELNGVERANEIAARASVNALEERNRSLERGAERASGAARELGFAFSSAFEDAILRGQKLSQVVAGLSQDIARVILRRTITDPLANAATGLIGSIDFGRLFNFGSSTATTTAPIVPVTSSPLPFASGGVFDRALPFGFDGGRRLGVLGEAGPEAVMPLQRDSSGRLGVRAEGGGGGLTVSTTLNIDARGADPEAEARIRALAPRIVQQSVAATLDAIRRGGTARAVARGV